MNRNIKQLINQLFLLPNNKSSLNNKIQQGNQNIIIHYKIYLNSQVIYNQKNQRRNQYLCKQRIK